MWERPHKPRWAWAEGARFRYFVDRRGRRHRYALAPDEGRELTPKALATQRTRAEYIVKRRDQPYHLSPRSDQLRSKADQQTRALRRMPPTRMCHGGVCFHGPHGGA